MPKGPSSIRGILLLTVSALTLMIAFLAASSVYKNWQRLKGVEALSRASVLSDELFDATEKLSIERDVALSMLEAPDRDTVENLKPRLAGSRADAVTALKVASAAVDRLEFPEVAEARKELTSHLPAIAALRIRIDRAVADHPGNPDKALATEWSSEVTKLMDTTQTLWLAFVKHYTDIDPIVTEQLWYKHFLRRIIDYSGRERSLISQLIAENATPSTAETAQLLRGQGIITQSWTMARILADQSGIYSVIAPYFSDAQSHYSTMHDMFESMVFAPGADHGATYPISADFWFELSNQALDSFTALRAASIKATQGSIDDLIAETEHNITLQLGVFAVALLLCGYSFWVIVHRVIRPINATVEALLKATNGEDVVFSPGRRQDEIGKLVRVLDAFREKSDEIKRASTELNRSESRLRAVFENVTDGLVSFDSYGAIEQFNPASELIFGYAAADVVGRNVRMLLDEAYRAALDVELERCVSTGEPMTIGRVGSEWEGQRETGESFPIDLALSAYALEDGIHFSAIVRDVTARKAAQEQRRNYTLALERSNKELDDFAYIASHDLKEPLRGIHNHSRFLLEDNGEKLDEDSVSRLNRLVFLSQRMEKLVNDLLYFSRLGRQELAIQPTDIDAVIRDIADTLDLFLKERKARIVVSEHLPTVVCDKPRVTELFRNLITNAVKYNDKDDRLVEIGWLASRKTLDGKRLANVFFVKDNGVGIDPEFHTDIFRIFKRLQKDKGGEDGTGVGLTFVKKIVERHGGQIWLESAVGQGTTFYFTLEAPRHDTRASNQAAA